MSSKSQFSASQDMQEFISRYAKEKLKKRQRGSVKGLRTSSSRPIHSLVRPGTALG